MRTTDDLKHLLIISFSDLAVDARVNRQIRLLRNHYRVTAVGYADPSVAGVEFVGISRGARSTAGKAVAAAMLKAGLYERFYWSSTAVIAAERKLREKPFDLILANDVNTLPLALSLGAKHGVVLDAHEYSPREMEDDWRWRFFFQRYFGYLCERYVPRVSGMITVCAGIAREYKRNFGVCASVVHNAPNLTALSPRTTAEGAVRLVHHGGATRSRKLENMIAMMAYLDKRFALDFYLLPTDVRYLQRLRRMAAGDARIRFLAPVPTEQLPKVMNSYDVGLYILEPNSFNNRHALPNKFFDFIQGRIAVAIGPSPEMARLVQQHNIGLVAQDLTPRSMATELSGLTSTQLDHYKRQADAAARILCYENSSQGLLQVLSAAIRG